MNLRQIANSITCGVNPNIQATLRQNNGFTYADDGSQVPSYNESTVTVQVQALNTQDLIHLGNMAQQGQYTTVYINGLLDAQIRSLSKGEDILIFNPPRENTTATWRVVLVAEGYSGSWTRVLVCRQ
ncbi:MAG: hypothetical protein [Caudoviricetes sp.]|nr:MAG: hypothetical protein [Caudoviricetes sp.]